MGAGQGKARRVQAETAVHREEWFDTLKQKFPLKRANADYILKHSQTLRRLVELSSEIHATGLNIALRLPPYQSNTPNYSFLFIDGHTALTHGAGAHDFGRHTACDCGKDTITKSFSRGRH